ncbi:O-methyltransferase [Bradyrhizobium sp. LM2.7]
MSAAFRAEPVYRQFKNATMVGHLQYIENLALASTAASGIAGAVIECGTWRGGMAAGLMTAMGPNRHYYFFDSFEGLPPATAEDGPAAAAYQAGVTSVHYRDNCSALVEEFKAVISRVKVASSNCHIIKGFYEKTFSTFDIASVGPIAVLRLDADWYESTVLCLQKFWPSVVEGGIVLIDDYQTWDGCTKAVNEFLANIDPIQRICQGPIGRVTYIIKRGAGQIG